MDNEELIDNYIDRQGVRGDTDFFLGDLNKINDTMNQIFNTKRSLGKTVNFQDVVNGSKQLIDLQKQLDAQTQNTVELQNRLDAALQAVNSTRRTGKLLTEDEARTRVTTQQTNRETIAGVKAQQDALEALRYEASQATKAAGIAQATARKSGSPEDSASASELSAKAATLNEALKQIQHAGGQDFLNVGNYTQSFVVALKTLEGELTNVKQKMTDLKAAGQGDTQAFKDAQTQAAALTTITYQQNGGFTSLTSQIRSSERALQTLEHAQLGGTTGFEQLRVATTDAAQAYKDFARQQKLLESEAPVLGALTLAARGLAGAYAIGQGAASLFADGNEKVAEKLNKLVAIMTVLTGLQEAYAFIQKSSGVITVIQNALLKSSADIQAKFAFSTNEAAAAQARLAAAELAASGAAEVEAGALNVVTISADAGAVAMDEAAVATDTFKTSLIATGIGAAILLIAGAIGYLLEEIPKWVQGSKLTAKEQLNLADAVKQANEAIIAQADNMEKLDGSSKRYYENLLAQSQAAGKSEIDNFAIRKNIALEEQQLAKDRIKDLGASYSTEKELSHDIDDLTIRRGEAIKEYERLSRIPDSEKKTTYTKTGTNFLGEDIYESLSQKDEQENYKKNIELYDKQLASKKTYFDEVHKALIEGEGNNSTTQKKLDLLVIEEAKYTEDERLKLILETTKLAIDLQKSRNQIVLEDDRSTLAKRLTAIKSNAAEEQKQINAEESFAKNKSNAKSANGQYTTETLIAIRKAADDRKKVNEKLRADEYKENYDFAQRDKAARLQVTQDSLNEQLKNDEAFLAEDKTQQQEQLDNITVYIAARQAALASSYAQQKALIESNKLNELSNTTGKNTTPEEIIAINKKYQEQLTDLNRTFGKRREDETQAEIEQTLRFWARYYKEREQQIVEGEDQQIIQLNNSLQKGNVSILSYNRRREKIVFDSDVKILQNHIDADKKAIDSTEVGTEERLALEEKLDSDLLALSQRKTDRDIQEKQKIYDALKDFGAQTLELVQTAVDARYENELNFLDRVKEKNNEIKDIESARIQGSTLDEIQKAATLQRLAITAATRNAAIDRQERKLKHDRAVADKAFAVASAIEQGAIKVVEAADNPILAAIIAATVAIAIAKIAATPIPAYNQGVGYDRSYHPGGAAWLGDGYEPEWVLEPGRPGYWSKNYPTKTILAAGSTVIPLHDIEEMAMPGLPMPQAPETFDGVQHAINLLGSKVDNQTTQIVKAIGKQKAPKIIFKSDERWKQRINKQVYGNAAN